MLVSIFSYGFILAMVVLLLNGGRISFVGGVSLTLVYLVYATGLGDALLSLSPNDNFNVIILHSISMFVYSLPLWWAKPKYCSKVSHCTTLIGFFLLLLMEWIVMVVFDNNISLTTWELLTKVDYTVNAIALLIIIIPNIKGALDAICNAILRFGIVHTLGFNGR